MSNHIDATHFTNGTEVEISSNDNGFRGAWYAGTVIKPKNSNKNNKHLIIVEYKTLMADESGTKPLRETLDVVHLRPVPPLEKRDREFKFSEEVDAYYNDGWWEGVVTGVLPGDRYSVFFRATREQLEFGRSELRIHREWVYGKWVPPVVEVEEEASISIGSKVCNNDKFQKGVPVEVCSDEDGFQGAWFAATVIEELSSGNFKIEYKSLRNDDDTAFMTEEVDINHIRPCPPNETIDHFCLFEEVDALHNDGWWVGVISKVLNKQRYEVFFRGTDEEIVFKQSDLRRHLEWINGKWVSSSSISNSMNRIMPPRRDPINSGTTRETQTDNLADQVAQQISAAIPNLVAQIMASLNANRPNQAGQVAITEQGCSYKTFMTCKPKKFYGTEGAVGLLSWIESMESVLHISKCAESRKVEYAACLLQGRALTWWNMLVHTRGREAAYRLTWEEFKKLLTEVYCSKDALQKLEIEFWNHSMVGTDIETYTARFHELARLVPHMVTPEEKQVDRYIWGLIEEIRGMVISSNPRTIQEAVVIANRFTNDVVRSSRSLKGKDSVGNKRKMEDQYRQRAGVQRSRRRW